MEKFESFLNKYKIWDKNEKALIAHNEKMTRLNLLSASRPSCAAGVSRQRRTRSLIIDLNGLDEKFCFKRSAADWGAETLLLRTLGQSFTASVL